MRATAATATNSARRALFALALAAGLPAAPALAGDAQAALQVALTVRPHTSLRIAQPASLTITESDVARGYAEVDKPVEVAVQSNVLGGYALVFERRTDTIRQAQVQGLGAPLTVNTGVVVAARPAGGHGIWREQVSLRFRFELAPGTQPGQHPWPIQISMMTP